MFPEINKNSEKKEKKTPNYSDKSRKLSINSTTQCKIHPGCIWSLNCHCESCKKIKI